MPQIINTNVSSLNAQRHLNTSQSAMKTSLERLSSGLRINSAKDDAAGLAISNRMTAQIRGMNQAIRNANDGISLGQTGDSALGEVTNALQRMRELSVQSRNATNSTSDRESLDAEFQQLAAEIDRIATTTAFNGRKILDGSFGSAAFQVGANVGETISVDVSTSMRTNSIGMYASRTLTMADSLNATTTDSLTMDADGDLSINGTNVGAAVAGTYGRGQNSAYAVANAINLGTDTHGVTAVANSLSKTFTAASLSNFGFTDATTADTLTYTLTINDQQIFVQGEADAVKTASDLASLINGFNETTGVTAAAQSNGDLVLTAADGRNIEIKEVLAGASDAASDTLTSYFGNSLTGAAATQIDYYKSTVSLSSSSSMTLDLASGAADFLSDTDLDPADSAATVEASGLVSRNILTTDAADLAISSIDQAIKDVDSFRGTFGAIQTRFESTISSLQASAENLSAARSRIRDTDFAAESAELLRTQILQQAGTAMLSQANALPQNVLSLLQ
ncbi:MAG: flagellin [Gammaproteobacteria bacterium]|nr:flagellin [Gammaproteobacteria bacterium]